VLHTSQPSISKQLKLLETELQVTLLRRGNRRILGLTSSGAHVVEIARRMLSDARRISSIGREEADRRRRRLTIVTTHLHANYVFPPLLEQFRRRFPDIELALVQAEPGLAFEMVATAKADIGVASASPDGEWPIVRIPGYELGRSLLVPPRHPLLKVKNLTLKQVSRYPLICYAATFAGGIAVSQAFEREGLEPNIAIRAIDTESIKQYVKLGLGVAVVHTIALDAVPERGLRAIDVTSLFGTATATIALRPATQMPEHAWYFLRLLAPGWSRERILGAMRNIAQRQAATTTPA
ncbi:MAG: LysR family transcriptional regulator, partial [Hyphomicrobiales bacterium]|nr:LysR family transcriptional regulator [Hyphomicrobiales bacterium]